VFERGARFWYRVGYTESGVRRASPAVAWTSPLGPSVATIEATIVHDALDNDVESAVRAGLDGDGGPVFTLPGTAGAVSSDWVNGTSVTGSQAWTFRIPVPNGAASAYLPPAAGHPWTLRVTEGGSLTRSGRVTAFKVTWHTPGGDQTYIGQPVPQQTVEGAEVDVSAPPSTNGVDGPGVTLRPAVEPNPARSGRTLRLALGREAGGLARVYDLAGREVAQVRLTATEGGWAGQWQARDGAGRALPPGLYLVRGRSGKGARVVLLDP